MELRWIFLLIMAVLPLSWAAYCPFNNSTNCHCEDYEGGHDLWCPTRYNHDYRFNYKGGVVWIACNPEKSIGGEELIRRATGIQLPTVHSLKLEHCPVLDRYVRLVDKMVNGSSNDEGLRRLYLEYSQFYGTTGKPQYDYGELQDDLFVGLDDLEELDIRTTDVDETKIMEGALNGLGKLKMLKLTSNRIKGLPEKLFWPTPRLTSLRLQEKAVPDFPEGLFEKLGDLQRLEIQVSNARKFHPRLFANLGKLESLEIRDMSLFDEDSIPRGIFDDLVSMRNFTLTGNGLEHSPTTLFSNTKLENFHWSLYRCRGKNCTLHIDGFFEGISTLRTFAFESAFKVNVSLAEDIFWGSDKLERFAVDRTRIESLPRNIFRRSKKLKDISLYRNRLTTLEDGVFGGLIKLKVLILRKNQISFISNSLLRGLTQLRQLDLSNNRIRTVESNAFASLKKLEELNLHENRVLYFNDTDQPMWSHLTGLRTLDMGGNNISLTSLPHEWSSTIIGLRTLNLSDNAIGPEIEVTELKFLQNEIFVDLSKNKITGLDFHSQALKFSKTLGPRSRGRDLKMPSIKLNDNPFACDCLSLDLAKFMHEELDAVIQTWFRAKIGEVVCQSPGELAGQALFELEYEKLRCPYPSNPDVYSDPSLDNPDACPATCECHYYPYDQETEVDCADSGSLLPVDLNLPLIADSKRVSLNLKNNGIKSLRRIKRRTRNFSAIAELFLDGNRLKEVSVADLPPRLETLSLAGNAISVFDAPTMDFLETLKVITLSENVFECSCESKGLWEFLHSNMVEVIEDSANVTVVCDGVPMHLIELELADICTDVKEVIIYYVLPFILLLLFVLVLIILYLHHKRTLYIWSYSKPWLRDCCFPIPPPDDMVYDVFVSYSSDDREFVEDLLVQQLEQGQSSELRYKCLMAIRDFNPGENILKQISDAVKTSRRTAVVLSKNFVRSTWYEHEFTAAYEENRVIVIVLGEVPTREEMGPLMWDYIKTNTYLAADDPWFWDKLRYALPHKGRRVFMKRRRAVTDKMQLLEKRSASSKPPSTNNANGSASDNTENAVATSENGAVNRGFTNASNPGNFYAVCSPPNSAQSNGHVMVTVDT